MVRSRARAEVRDLQGVQVGDSPVSTVPTRSHSRCSRTCQADMTRLIMECHDRVDSDTSRGRDECLRANTAPSAGQPRGRNSSPQAEHNQLREHGVSRDDRVSNTSNDAERALRPYLQQFQKKANHSPRGAASSTRSSKDANSVKVSRQPSSAA